VTLESEALTASCNEKIGSDSSSFFNALMLNCAPMFVPIFTPAVWLVPLHAAPVAQGVVSI